LISAISEAEKCNNPDRLGEFDDKFEKTVYCPRRADFSDPDQWPRGQLSDIVMLLLMSDGDSGHRQFIKGELSW